MAAVLNTPRFLRIARFSAPTSPRTDVRSSCASEALLPDCCLTDWSCCISGAWKFIDHLRRYLSIGLRRLSPPRGAGWEPGDILRGIRRAKKTHLVGAIL